MKRMKRRGFLGGLLGFGVAAPAVLRIGGAAKPSPASRSDALPLPASDGQVLVASSEPAVSWVGGEKRAAALRLRAELLKGEPGAFGSSRRPSSVVRDFQKMWGRQRDGVVGPHVRADSSSVGVDLPPRPYAPVVDVGRLRRRQTPMALASHGPVPPGGTAALHSGRLGTPFQPDRIIVPSEIADHFMINDFRCDDAARGFGHFCDLWHATTRAGVSAAVFSDAARSPIRLDMPIARESIEMKVTNVSGAARGFHAAVIGTQPEFS